MKLKNLFCYVLCSLILVMLSGCLAAVAAYEAVSLAAAVGPLEKVSVDAAVSPGVTKEKLAQIRRVTFIFGEGESKPNEVYLSGGLTNILVDNLTIEMMKLGYECVDNHKLKNFLKNQGSQSTGTLTLDDAIKAAKNLGIQAVITGTVRASSSSKMGLTNISSTSLIQNASIKIIDAEDSSTLMVVAINYKKGKKPNKAAESMAKIIKSKLENPFGESKKK